MPDGDNLPERVPGRYLTHADVDLMFRLAKAYALSAFWEEVNAEAKAFVIIEAGRELGLMPFESFQYIDVIKGKPVLNSAFFATSIRRHEHYDYVVDTLDADSCTITFVRDGEILGVSTFDQEDAQAAGLTRPSRSGDPSMYTKYPRNMLFARALSNGAAWFTPDVVTVRPYVEGEIEDEYLETKAQREAARAAERLALAEAQGRSSDGAPARDTPKPEGPAEEVIDVAPEPAPASARADEPAKEEKPKRRSRKAAQERADAAARQEEADTGGSDGQGTIPEPAPTPSLAAAAADQETNIAAVRALVISGLQGEARKDCHESLKFLGIWGPEAPKELWLRFGRKALDWSTLEPALNVALEEELLRQEAESQAAIAAADPDPNEPPFAPEQVVDVTPEPDAAPAEEQPPWEES